MKKLLLLLGLATIIGAQTTTNLGMVLPPTGTTNWGPTLNANFSKIDAAIGSLQNAFQGTWSSSVTYAKGQSVTYNGNYYISILNTNLNHNPATATSYWTSVATTGVVVQTSDPGSACNNAAFLVYNRTAPGKLWGCGTTNWQQLITGSTPVPTTPGMVKTDGAALQTAVAGTDYATPISVNVAQYANVAAAVTAIASTQTTLVVSGGTFAISSSLTIPANITLDLRDAILNISSGQILTIVGGLKAADQQIFTGSGTVSFANNAKISEVSVKWWGATGDGSTDDTALLQKAFVSVTTGPKRLAVRIPAATYRTCNLFLGNSATSGCPSSAECAAPARVYSVGGVSALQAVFKATSTCGGSAGDFVLKANSVSGLLLESIGIDGGATTAGTGASCLDVSYKFGTNPAARDSFRNLDINNCKDAASNYAIDADQLNDSSFDSVSINGSTHTGNMIAFSLLAGNGQAGPISGLKIYNSVGYFQGDALAGQVQDSMLTGGVIFGFGGSSGTVSHNLWHFNNVQIGVNPASGIVVNALKSTGSTSSVQSFICTSCNLSSTSNLVSGQYMFGGYFTAGATIVGGETHVGTGAYFAPSFASGSSGRPQFKFTGAFLAGSSLPTTGSIADVVTDGSFDAVTTNTILNSLQASISAKLGATSGSAIQKAVSGGLGPATYPDVISLWTTCTSGWLKFDGTCSTPANTGGVSAGNGTIQKSGAGDGSFNSATADVDYQTGGVWNVKTAGATGNGTTIDGPVISALISTHPNSRIYFPAGNYLLNNSSGASGLTLNNFQGELDFAPDAHLIGNTASSSAGWILNIQGGTGGRINNLWAGYSNESGLPLVRASASNGAVQIANVTDFVINKAHINASTGLGLIFITSTNAKAYGVSIANTTADGLSYINTQDGFLSGYYASNTGDDMLSVLNYSAYANNTGFVGTNIRVYGGHTRGISVVGQSNVSISNFFVSGVTNDGLIVLTDAGFGTRRPSGVTFSNGIVVTAGASGAEFYLADNISFNNVQVKSPNLACFVNSTASGNVNNLQISNSLCTGATNGAGMFLTYIFGGQFTNNSVVSAGFEGYYTAHSANMSFYNSYANDVAKLDSTNHYAIWNENNTGPVTYQGVNLVDDQATPTGYVIGDFSNGSNLISVRGINAVITNGAPIFTIQSTLTDYELLGTLLSTKTANYTATVFDRSIKCDATSGARTITLPAAPIPKSLIYVKKIDASANTCTINSNGKNIDGASTLVIPTPNQSLILQYDGTTWSIF